MKTQKVIYSISYEDLHEILGLPKPGRVVQITSSPDRDAVLVKVYDHGPLVLEGSIIPIVEWKPDRDDIGLTVHEEGESNET